MSGRRQSDRTLELPCVWSLAGVLGAHPCDREYDCDSCELYHALSGRHVVRDASESRSPILSQSRQRLEADVGQIVSAVLSGCRLELGRWYGGDGVWVDPGDTPGQLDVGLVGCVWRILQPIDEVVAPRTGVSFDAGETCGWLMRSDRAIPIRIPVSGTVADVNDSMVEQIGRSGCVESPDTWLFRIRSAVQPGEVPLLFRGEEALIWQLRRVRILKAHLRNALETEHPAVGTVMADGGVPQTDLESILGPAAYSAMLDAMF